MTHAADQFMIYHLYEWDAVKQKYKKKPVGLQGEALMTDGGIPTSPDRAAVTASAARLGAAYRVGLWLTAESNLFFLDLDDAVDISTGRLTAQATAMAQALVAAGCYFEPSSSGRGAHVLGRYSGQLQRHSNKREAIHHHEFYTRDRGCVLATADQPTMGSWDVDATLLLPALLTEHFPPRVTIDLIPVGSGPRAEWRGPADDDVLIRRMLTATGSAAARLGGKVALAKLWAGECEHDSQSDMALAAHLAFWTGCDVDRMERLMRRSGLVRDKWNEHRTYLRDKTITIACATTSVVYQEPIRIDTASLILGSPGPVPSLPVAAATTDWHAAVDGVISAIHNCGTSKDLIDNIMPSLGTYGWPRLHGERVVTALNEKLDLFRAKMPVAELRRLVMPPVSLDAALVPTVPEWAQPLVYVLKTDKFFDTATGSEHTHEGLRMAYSRFMPMRQTGNREDPVSWLRDRWQITTVQDVQYRPDQAPIFEQASKTYANSFRASTIPTPVIGSTECSACIDLFQRHLADLVGQREPLYAALLGWIAHNVQRPGVKIRWAPLVKGAPGDGKSIIGDLIFATLGEANVNITSTSTISNSGGFTDWAIGGCVNVIEEIRLEGKERRKLYNAMKTIIADGRINPNRKNVASGGTLTNITNHCAFTNHQDALPIENGDRRWNVIFTPWNDANEAARVKGLLTADALPAYFRRLAVSMRSEPGAWRAWLMSIDLSSFDADGRAPYSHEREAMMISSEDYVEQIVRDVIDRGSPGVDKMAFCSSSLMGRVQVELGEKPDTRSWNRILNDLGYHQSKPMTWNGKTRRIWIKKPMTNDQITEILNRSAFPDL